MTKILCKFYKHFDGTVNGSENVISVFTFSPQLLGKSRVIEATAALPPNRSGGLVASSGTHAPFFIYLQRKKSRGLKYGNSLLDDMLIHFFGNLSFKKLLPPRGNVEAHHIVGIACGLYPSFKISVKNSLPPYLGHYMSQHFQYRNK
jgi:hypothetical protein